MTPILLVNFGGPRNLDEVFPFLKTLLCDQDVVRTHLPTILHNWFFTRVAKKRTLKVSLDYEIIGGKSPIYFDTETIANELGKKLNTKIYTFHRYLPDTHTLSFNNIQNEKNLTVLPLFPQFSYSTTGSIARVLSPFTQLSWIRSYPTHPAFIDVHVKKIKEALKTNLLKEEETILLFSAHGLPQKFVDEGDSYQKECEATFENIKAHFPNALSKLCYQSKFGKGEWLRPYTDEASESILTWSKGRKTVLFIPISFTTDHIETLFEIEKLYLPKVQEKGLNAIRVQALNLDPDWINALIEIIKDSNLYATKSLIR